MKRLALAILVVILVGAGAGAWARARLLAPYRGYAGEEQFVEIPPGTSTRAIGDRLVSAGIVRDHVTFRLALWRSGQARRLQAGEYRFAEAMPAPDVVDKIARGDVFVIPITVPEGLTFAEMSRIFDAHRFGPAEAFVAAARDPSPIRALDPAATDLEGYLFPETYSLPRKTNAATLVRAMVDRFERVVDERMRDAAKARGLSIRELVTLASLVEKETARPEERPIVAAVYQNRLRIGMGLQCDPTVIYALQRAGKYTGNLSRTDLQFDSPYNTYRYAGLPPGPIASPGRASLDAVLHPAAVEYLYFVSRNDGSHEFARTLDEHNRNVRKFQVEFFRKH